MGKKKDKRPAQQGQKKKGGIPPPEHRFKPGQSGNPSGRPAAGAAIEEWINAMGQQQLAEDEIRKIARDRKAPWTKRAAAERILRTFEAGDLADFSDLLKGKASLEELRQAGLNTEVVKKFKQKSRMQPTGDGDAEEVIEREIELFDRSGNDFDRIMDRTKGRPMQSVEAVVTEKRADLLSEADRVRGYLELEVPEHKWPPATLARYKAGKIEGVEKPGGVA